MESVFKISIGVNFAYFYHGLKDCISIMVFALIISEWSNLLCKWAKNMEFCLWNEGKTSAHLHSNLYFHVFSYKIKCCMVLKNVKYKNIWRTSLIYSKVQQKSLNLGMEK